MDFEEAKENIQPLASGRDASLLQASLRLEAQELLAQRRQMEDNIHNYEGDDPLEAWYSYISWIEQCFPSGGKESGLEEVLTKCLTHFENDERYYQDRRMIKLYIKFISSHKNSIESYQQLFNAGIGTMVSDFYISWAYCYDLVGNTRKADEIFKQGVACRAQPLDELKEAQQHFGFSVAQRYIYGDDECAKDSVNRQLEERRLALTSLRGYSRKAKVGSIRTGAAVKNYVPGTIQTDSSLVVKRSNAPVKVFSDENEQRNVLPKVAEEQNATAPEESKSVIRTIIESVRSQENNIEPGPWNKAHDKKKRGKLFTKTHEPGFNIHEDQSNDNELIEKISTIQLTDDEKNIEKPFKYYPNFAIKNKPQEIWSTPVTTEEEPNARSYPQYNKCMLYPRANMEFQLEELMAYNWYKRRNISNAFTNQRDIFWDSHNINVSIRKYPNFASHSRPQELGLLDSYFEPPKIKLVVSFHKIYNSKTKTEYQFEELLAIKFMEKCNNTVCIVTDMDETICQSAVKAPRRKSFFPTRHSIAVKNSVKAPPSPIKETNSTIFVEDLVQTNSAEIDVDAVKTQSNTAVSIVPHINQNLPSVNMPNTKTQEVPNIAELEEPVNGGMSQQKFQPFEIYEDPTTSINFKFKRPALRGKPTKPVLDILTVVPPPQVEKVEPVGFFDADETCSTQTFNIFLKSQSASTPKVPIKTTQRHFGTTLKETAKPVSAAEPEEHETILNEMPTHTNEVCTQSNNAPISAIPAVLQYSPTLQKQLSTILETSEHGTTQGTHSTGTSTKSTISSPDFENENQPNTATRPLHTDLETVFERSQEVSGTNSKENILLSNVNLDTKSISSTTTTNKHPAIENIDYKQSKYSPSKVPTTPAATRLHNLRSNVSVLDEFAEECEIKEAGNFSRLMQCEDTAPNIAMRTVRFQDDKTETVPTLLVSAPNRVQFQEDKTETISKMLIQPVATDQKPEEDKLNNSLQMIFLPPKPIRFEDEYTETMPKLMFKSHDTNNASIDDSFQFFVKTPPAIEKSLVKQNQQLGITKQISTVKHPSPLVPKSKRFCDIDTPEVQTNLMFAQKPKENTKKTMLLFEDEISDKSMKLPKDALLSFRKSSNISSKNILEDSFLPDFSIIAETQPKLVQNKDKLLIGSSHRTEITKPEQDDSLLSNLSFISETQPTANPQKENTKNEISETQPTANPQKENTKNEKSEAANLTGATTNISVKRIGANISANQHQVDNTNRKHETIVSGDSFMHDFSIGDNRPLQVSTKSQNISNSFFHLNKSETKDSNASSFIKPKSQLQFRNTQNNTHEMQDLSVVLNSQPQKENLKAFSSGGSTLKFLSKPSPKVPTKTNYENSQSNLNFLEKPKTDLNSECKEPQKQTSKNSDLDDFFELNAETALFSTNISLIKNSTLVSNYPQKTTLEQTHEIRRQVTQDCKKSKQSFLKQPSSFVQDTVGNRSNLNATEKSPAEKHRTSTASTNKPATNYENAASALGIGDYFNKEKLNLSNEYDDEMSIYFKNTPRTPKNTVHVWRDSLDKSDNNSFVHRQCDLNQTNQLVERFCVDPNVNPFNVELINAFLDQIDLITFLKDLQTCRMVGCVPCIKPNTTIEINGVHFQISKLIGEGAYGAVYKGIDTKTGDKYALKQERPPNYWEYYICLELQSRITSENMLNAYMKIEFSLIGNNSSVLVSKFSDYGSLINVCNKVKKSTMKNVDEYVVMYLTCELLEIMDHLHAANIIHADIKPDNILLMNKLTYPAKQCCLQLIDFGVSIDMQLFKPGQTFSYVHNNNAFNCVEMRDKRPWTYQLDLYGLAGVIHVLLFGKYMEVEKRSDYIWMHKTHVPRYFNKILWETIFRELLNVRDCNSMPNLQQLRAIIKREIIEKEKFVINKIAEFNKALSS
ncbi:uncharacterized protein LOC119668921 [Teleopsis dalmanni]|uniref:uncharacterized protein LOC119668921 n=1 Tax=Teleopsis dalmanni TaxID=139649 RepID=UPI0018CE9280|nr:uncharacterized protein LOC119668921 [Teleopsis dalmanni]